MSKRYALAAPRIFDGEVWHENAAIVFDDDKVETVAQTADLNGMPIELLKSGFLAPGFVDLQVNGGGGVLLNNQPTVEGIATICAAHAKYGSGALLPTLITDENQIRDKAIDAGIEAAKQNVPGFTGLHLEGPNLSVARKGAHDPALIRSLNDADIATLIAARQALPALLTTVAVESVTPAQVSQLVAADIKVSIGHSDATYEDAMQLIDAGASFITHLFNAMSPFTGRAPGIVGAALNAGTVSAGLISDGYHVHPQSMALALRAKEGPGRIFLVTDAMSTVGTDVSEFNLNGRTIYRKDGKLTLEDGTLAGADLDMATAIRVMRDSVGADLDEALKMAALYPAKAMGLSNLGSLKPGAAANAVWLDDKLYAQRTWVGGTVAS